MANFAERYRSEDMRWSGEARKMQHPTTGMKTNHNNHIAVRKANNSTEPASQAAVDNVAQVFLGIDAAKTKQVVSKFVPGEGAKPAEGMLTQTLLKRVGTLLKRGLCVHCVYEAGPTGFALARQLIALGATCLVVRPRRLDRYGRRRKTDPLDAQHLAEDLAAHHFGRKGLLRPVRLPTEAEELRRLVVREREMLSRNRHQLLNSAKGRALALGYSLPKQWWRPRILPDLLKHLPKELAAMLQRTALVAQTMREQLEAIETQIKADAPEAPRGVGALTVGVLEREVCDWRRFPTAKKLASFVGLCPSEDSSGTRHQLGAIDKHGSPRLRFWCQETAWRLFKFQPGYHAVLWARERLAGANTSRAKQIAVALARRFLVDWWRIRTGQATCAQLGLVT